MLYLKISQIIRHIMINKAKILYIFRTSKSGPQNFTGAFIPENEQKYCFLMRYQLLILPIK